MKYLVLLLLAACVNPSNVDEKLHRVNRYYKQAEYTTYYKICNSKNICYCKTGNTESSVSMSCEFFDTLE